MVGHVYPSPVHAGIHEQTAPEQTPPGLTPPGRHPLTDTYTPPSGRHTPWQTHPWADIPWQAPPGQTQTPLPVTMAVDGMHPTGMLSC